MNLETLKTLDSTSPNKFSARVILNRVNAMEAELGMALTKPPCNALDLNRQIGKLESMLAVKIAAPKIVPTASIAPPVSEAINFQTWRTMSDADQRSFCRDGGQMKRESFLNEMTPAGQSFFLSCGGKLETYTPPDLPKTKNPPANSMWRDDFMKLEPKAQTAHFAAGKKIHD